MSGLSTGIASFFNTLSSAPLLNSPLFHAEQLLTSGWHHRSYSQVNDLSIAKSSYFPVSDGPTIDPGNTLKDRSFSKLVVFGDSLSDLGNLSTAAANLVPPIPFPPLPYAQTGSIGQFTGFIGNTIKSLNEAGRLTSGSLTGTGFLGNLWVDYLAHSVGLQNKVEDFAYIGSTSGRDNVVRTSAPNLPPGLKLPGVLDQIDAFVANSVHGNQKADPNALYFVWGGANDFLTVLPSFSISKAIDAVVGGVANVVKAVTTLANDGAETIVVPNLPDLGLTPFAAGKDVLGNPSQPNVEPIATLFSVGFDLLLQPTLANLEQQLKKVNPKVDIVQMDILSLSERIAQHPEHFGFTNTTDPLFGKLTSVPPVNPNEFVFADNFHPTTRTHALFADFFQQALTHPVASHVFEASTLAINDLIHSGTGASAVSSLFGLTPSLL